MTKPNALEAIDRTDYASCGPVRARVYRFCKIDWRALLTISAAILWAGIVAAAQRPSAPDMGFVAGIVESYFAALPDYEPGDLITRSQIEQVLAKLDDSGATVPGADKIIERGLGESSFVAKELGSKSGRKFMRKLARNPSSFSHLDRLSRMPRGEQTIRDLIRQKDGDKMIEYLATTKGGKNMGRMMANAHNGSDLNKPTGRIYTVADLLDAIKAAYTSPQI
jgi:hypothetical protein